MIDGDPQAEEMCRSIMTQIFLWIRGNFETSSTGIRGRKSRVRVDEMRMIQEPVRPHQEQGEITGWLQQKKHPT